jgi:hypothetical protein
MHRLVSGLGWTLVMLGLASASAHGQGPPYPLRFQQTEHQFVMPCGGAGMRCCRPQPAIAGHPTLAHCDSGLGCDIATDTCVSPCGGAGEVCCDGPETRAQRWTADGRVHSPSGLLRDMCVDAACDSASRRCLIGCGHSEGQACCGPQPSPGVAACPGDGLYCEFDAGTTDRGVCRTCGKPGGLACRNGCEGRFVPDQNNVCVPCGALGQQSCSQAPDCEDGARSGPGGLCIPCGSGDARQLVCTSGAPCRGFSIPDPSGKRCMPTALVDMPCMDGQCREGICTRGVCRPPPPPPPCGGLNERTCDLPAVQCREGAPREGYCRAHDWNPYRPPNEGRCCWKANSVGSLTCVCEPLNSCPVNSCM